MIEKPSYDELSSRIKKNLEKYQGDVPRHVITCWEGYLAGLLEWSLISVDVNDRLRGLLPGVDVDDSPVVDIMLGN